MKICANCGATLQDNAVFCIACNCREFKPYVMPDLNAPEPEKPRIEYDQYGRPIGRQYEQPEYEQPHFTEGFSDGFSDSFHDPFGDSYSETADYPQYLEQYSPNARQYQQQYEQPQVQQYQQQYEQPQVQQYQQQYEQPQVQQYQQQYEQPQVQQYQQQYEQPQVQQYQQQYEQPQVQQYQQQYEQPQVQQYQQQYEQPQVQQYQQQYEQPQVQQYQQQYEQPQVQQYQQQYEQPQVQQYQQQYEQPQEQPYQQQYEQPQERPFKQKRVRKTENEPQPEPEVEKQPESVQQEPPKPVFDSKNFVYEKKETSEEEAANKQLPKSLKGIIANLQNTRDFTANYNAQDFAAHKTQCILASLGITFWVPYVACRDSQSSRFYANQGLLTLIMEIVFGFIFSLFGNIINTAFMVNTYDGGYQLSFAGWIVSIIVAAIVFAIPAFVIVTSIMNIRAGKIKEIPFLGKLRLIP